MGNYGAKQTEDSDIERTPEYASFIETLQAYHKQRGTHFSKEPSLGPRKISLLKLYNKIIGYGGYDKVSDTPLMWRRIADEYHVPPMSNAGMAAYILKNHYYKNLAAFEIESHWKKKAPPPELLEQQTARGGAILSRPEVINPPPLSEIVPVKTSRAANSSKAAYYQQPTTPQPVVLTQPTHYIRPVAPSEYVRPLYPMTAGQFGSQTLHDQAANNIQPLVSRSFITQHTVVLDTDPRTSPASLSRATLALKSGLESEVSWATKHLVRASYELADDLVLEKIGGLTEALLCSIHEGIIELTEANANRLRKQGPSSKRRRLQFVQSKFLSTSLEAALVLRNVAMQPDNAKFVARLPITSTILLAGLSLPVNRDCLEMRQQCIEICDSLLPSLTFVSEEDPLYRKLASLLHSEERSELLLGLRAMTRCSISDEHNRLVQDIEQSSIARMILYLHLEDRELLLALISFFFQYTTYSANIKALSASGTSINLIRRLSALMMWQAEYKVEEILVATADGSPKAPIPTTPPQLPDDIVRELLTFPEPDRAIHWMRACFEEDKEQSVTQILLWQSYRTLFTPFSLPSQVGQVMTQGKPLLQAADVIKMVGNAFTGATAMVVKSPTEGQKFIIRGIKCREFPKTPSGKSYVACKWLDATNSTVCSAPFASPKDLYQHLIAKHVKTATGPIQCGWSGCHRFPAPGETNLRKVANHLRVHLPEDMTKISQEPAAPKNTYINVSSDKTATDEKGEAKGLALTAALTLRNILRSEPELLETSGISGVQFDSDLLGITTENPSIAPNAIEVLILRHEKVKAEDADAQ